MAALTGHADAIKSREKVHATPLPSLGYLKPFLQSPLSKESQHQWKSNSRNIGLKDSRYLAYWGPRVSRKLVQCYQVAQTRLEQFFVETNPQKDTNCLREALCAGQL